MRLDVRAFGLTCGLLWGLGVFLLAWWVMAFDGITHEATPLGRVYRGFSLSPAGSLVGLAWGFADGLLGGLLFAWLYNRLSGRLTRPAK